MNPSELYYLLVYRKTYKFRLRYIIQCSQSNLKYINLYAFHSKSF